MVRFRFRAFHFCGPDPEAHGRGVLAVVADTDKGLLVLSLVPDDGQWRAISTRVGAGLALDGDIVPGQGPVWMGFDDGFLGREPRHREN